MAASLQQRCDGSRWSQLCRCPACSASYTAAGLGFLAAAEPEESLTGERMAGVEAHARVQMKTTMTTMAMGSCHLMLL